MRNSLIMHVFDSINNLLKKILSFLLSKLLMSWWLNMFSQWNSVNILKHEINILRILTNVKQFDYSRMRNRSQVFDFLDQIIRSMGWLHHFLFAIAFDCDTSNCLFFLSKSNLCIWSLSKNCWRQNILVVKRT